MKLIERNNFKAETHSTYNHQLEQKFTVEVLSFVLEVEADVFTEVNSEGEVVDFDVSLLDNDSIMAIVLQELIEEFLIKELKPLDYA